MSRFLGLDLGGTNVKAAIAEVHAGEVDVVATASQSSNAVGGPDAVVRAMVEIGMSLVADHDSIEALGVGVPGLFEFDTGRIVFFTNLPGPWEGFPLRSRLAEAFGTPATLINDARSFALAEGTVGAGKGHRAVLCLTLGTGIGGGLIIDNRLQFGAFGVAGEVGHQTIEIDGPRCGCGNRGCVEAFARGPAICEAAGQPSVEEVIAAADRGDQRSSAALARAVEALAIGIANVVTVIGPDLVVLGGGMMRAGDRLLGPIREGVRDRITLVPPERIEIVRAQLGPEAGAIGAALAARGSPSGEQQFLEGEVPSAVRRRGERENPTVS